MRRSSSAVARRRLRRIGLAGDDGRQRRGAAAATAGAAAPLEAVLAILRFRELAAACAARASSEPMEQLDGIAVGLRGCPRPIEWSKERQDGDQEQEHEVGQCDSVVGVFLNEILRVSWGKKKGAHAGPLIMMRKKVVFTQNPACAPFFFPQDTLRIPFLKRDRRSTRCLI